MSTPTLIAKNISKSFHYPKTIHLLNNISLTVNSGESIAIIGRSGEGKSTLLQILGTLEKSCEGSLYISGEKVGPSNRDKIRNAKLGFVFQSFHLMEDETAIHNVLMPARIAGVSIASGGYAEKRALELLERVDLKHRAYFQAKLLSGGEKQRVALARAMCNNPDLILADEPSGNLDRQTAEIIHELLLDFVREGKSLLIVTHDKQLANLCTRQYELHQGTLVPI